MYATIFYRLIFSEITLVFSLFKFSTYLVELFSCHSSINYQFFLNATQAQDLLKFMQETYARAGKFSVIICIRSDFQVVIILIPKNHVLPFTVFLLIIRPLAAVSLFTKSVLHKEVSGEGDRANIAFVIYLSIRSYLPVKFIDVINAMSFTSGFMDIYQVPSH